MLNLKEYNKSKDVKKFVQKIFETRHLAHNAHLKTKSYSEHVALNEFYDKLLEMTDDFVETFQGQYGLLGDIEISTKNTDNIMGCIEEFVVSVKAARDFIKDSHLQNILDEIISLTYKTIYKLKYLK